MTTKFTRIATGHYADQTSGWTIERQGPATARRDRADWYVKNAAGTVMRVRQTFAEAEMAAHDALSESEFGGDGVVAATGDTPPPPAAVNGLAVGYEVRTPAGAGVVTRWDGNIGAAALDSGGSYELNFSDNVRFLVVTGVRAVPVEQPLSADAPAVGSPAYESDTRTVERMRSVLRNRVTDPDTRTDADALRDTQNHHQGSRVHAADADHGQQLRRAGLTGKRGGLTRRGSIVAERLRNQALDDAFGPL